MDEGLIRNGFRPLSLALMGASLILGIVNFIGEGLLGSSNLAILFAIAWFLVAISIAFGFLHERWLHFGLAACFSMFLLRFFSAGFVGGFSIGREGVWLSLCWALAAAGTYILEKNGRRRK